jgi:hypothetical protein
LIFSRSKGPKGYISCYIGPPRYAPIRQTVISNGVILDGKANILEGQKYQKGKNNNQAKQEGKDI